jgi:thioredoxin 1
MSTSWWFAFDPNSEIPTITPEDLFDVVQKSPNELQIVDVRTETEFKNGHIQGAINCSLFPPWNFHERLKKLNLNSEIPITAICLSGHRSVSGVKVLKELGFLKVNHLEKGMQNWRLKKLLEVKEE